ncbi:MAG: hypothetical protein CMJ52_00035 [Planctomycetaceae bacterium]|nr:hypothetical protein [Planctomycetaceae bacterium]
MRSGPTEAIDAEAIPIAMKPARRWFFKVRSEFEVAMPVGETLDAGGGSHPAPRHYGGPGRECTNDRRGFTVDPSVPGFRIPVTGDRRVRLSDTVRRTMVGSRRVVPSCRRDSWDGEIGMVIER